MKERDIKYLMKKTSLGDIIRILEHDLYGKRTEKIKKSIRIN